MKTKFLGIASLLLIPLSAMAEQDIPSPTAQCKAGPDAVPSQVITALTRHDDPAALMVAFEAIARAKAEPAAPIKFGPALAATGTLWLSLDDPDASSLIEEAISMAGTILIRLPAFTGQAPAKAALLHMLLEHKKFSANELPHLVSTFQTTDLFTLLDKYDDLPKCARTAANLRVQADTDLAVKRLGRLDRTVFIGGSTD